MAFFTKYLTRRQQIHYEANKDYIKLGLIAVLLLVIMFIGIGSCVSRRAAEEQKAAEAAAEAAAMQEDAEREKIDVESYPRLVSADSPLAIDYEPPQLTRLYGMPDGVDIFMNFEAATAFTRLYDAMVADGLGIIPLSGYRTYDEQSAIFSYNLELHISEGMEVEAARRYTMRYVALPGTSEHQYGRSIDVTVDGTTDHDFQKTEQGKWLINNAHRFGFVLRYPEDKEPITGIAYEPWHLRYVGTEHAEYMYKYDLCLEEYIKLVRRDCPRAVEQE